MASPGETPSPPTHPSVVLTVADAVATVRLNRPAALNSLDLDTKTRLLTALQQAADDPTVRCVVLTGTGRAFSAGQDLVEHRATLTAGGSLNRTVLEHYNPIVELLATMAKPVVAAVNGIAAGAGASFAFAADLRVVADTAGFNLAFAGVALSCDSGASWTLPRLVGMGRAKELLLMPRTVGAAEALSLGLATLVVPAASLDEAVAGLAGRLAAGPTLAFGAIRRALAYSAGHGLTESLTHEAALMELTGASDDHRAAVAAFVAKETPTYQGR